MTTLQRVLNKALKSTSPLWCDKAYIKAKFRVLMGYSLDLKEPHTFNEKLQWLKLNNRHDDMTRMVDKIAVKQCVSQLIGEEYIIPTLGVWQRAEDIDFNSLPRQVVIKTNHSGGNTGVAVIEDMTIADRDTIREKMSISLKSHIFPNFREWPYKNVVPQIFAEQYIGRNPIDYKFYCFNGVAKCVMVCLGRETGHTKFYFFDSTWNLLRINRTGKEAPEGFTIDKPQGMDKMFSLAAKLSEGLPFARVDFYNQNGRIYFGEITFYPASGFDPNYLPETDLWLGSMINLSVARNDFKR